MSHLSTEQLEAGLDEIRRAPADDGTLEMIVRRPAVDAREVLDEGELDIDEGLVGDNWNVKPAKTPDGSPDPEAQLNVMNARVTALVAQDRDRWALAGDQLYLDLDLSLENLPAGVQLAIGSAIIEVTAKPHTGCKKFVSRYGADAVKFVNSPTGKKLRMRGLNARVVQRGTIKAGDAVRKISR